MEAAAKLLVTAQCLRDELEHAGGAVLEHLEGTIRNNEWLEEHCKNQADCNFWLAFADIIAEQGIFTAAQDAQEG